MFAGLEKLPRPYFLPFHPTPDDLPSYLLSKNGPFEKTRINFSRFLDPDDISPQANGRLFFLGTEKSHFHRQLGLSFLPDLLYDPPMVIFPVEGPARLAEPIVKVRVTPNIRLPAQSGNLEIELEVRLSSGQRSFKN
jgi:hypothetical protein